MQYQRATRFVDSFRSKLLLALALVAVCALAAPTAIAHGRYHGHGDRSGNLLGALVVGAVIGGALVSASQQGGGAYYGDAGYPPQPYPPQPYYQSYPAYPPAGAAYVAPAYGYVPTASVGVVYTSGPSRAYYGNGGYRGNRRNDGRGHYYQRQGR